MSKWFGKDIRLEGTTNVGARNAGRLYGKKAFVFTFIGDCIKGVVIILIGRILDYSTSILLVGLFFTCIGHIFPLFFRFKGGKGISTFIGGLITIYPILICIIIISFCLFYLLYRSFTIPGFFALVFACISFLFLEQSIIPFFISFCLLVTIIMAHGISYEQLIPKKWR